MNLALGCISTHFRDALHLFASLLRSLAFLSLLGNGDDNRNIIFKLAAAAFVIAELSNRLRLMLCPLRERSQLKQIRTSAKKHAVIF